MSEQNLGIEVPGEVKPQEVVERLAGEFGWKPKEEYEANGGNPDNWIPPEDYIRKEKKIRENLSLALEKERAEKEQTRRTLDSLKNHYMQLRSSIEKEFKEEIKALKQAKQNLVREGEVERALAIDTQIDMMQDKKEERLAELQADQAASQQGNFNQELANELQAEMADWMSVNSWYRPNTGDKNTQLADDIAIAWTARNGLPNSRASYKAMLRHVEQELKDIKPNLFSNPNQKRGDRVDDGGGEKTSSKDNIPKFTAEQEAVYKSMVEMDVRGEDGKPLTKAQLWREWKSIGAV